MRLHTLFLLPLLTLPLKSAPVSLSSPDSQIQITFSAQPAAPLTYQVRYKGYVLIAPSRLGLELQEQPDLGDDLSVVTSRPAQIDETYNVPAGKSNPIRNQCNALEIELRENTPTARTLTLQARAYNDGVAFRYGIPGEPHVKILRIANERTQFKLSEDVTAYPLVLRNFTTSWEDNYRTVAVSALHPESLIALPLLLNFPGHAWVAVTEAHIENYSGMYLRHSGDTRSQTLEARLSPHIDEPGLAVSGLTPMQSPWRVLMIADSPGRLIESNIVENLNPPSALADTSWIKPGKAAWDWWSGPYDENVNFKVGKNTVTAEHYIDFAATSGFPYFLLDGGWAAHGNGPAGSEADITRAQPDIDLPTLLAYAKSKNVKIWLWSHWSDVERQMAEAFPLYEKWGIAGVKIDYMDRDDQWMVDFYHRVARSAADHHLMVDFHGAYKPDGLRRTYPNVITREGVLGLEYNKWSARVTPDHNVMLAFTRLLAGPMDYTPGGFTNVTRDAFVPRNKHPMVMGTRAHQTALFVVFQSPFEMVSDYPEAYTGQKEFPFLKAVPTSWDEIRVLNAQVGDYITIARRHGDEWYVGSIAGSHPAQIEIPLEFLGPGRYLAESVGDAPDADLNPTHTAVAQQNVTRSQTLKVNLAPGGGHALRLRPVQP